MSQGVGADIESICAKCGDVWHVIVAKVADKIVKVQCKECGATHRHRPPGGETVKAGQPVAKRSTKKPVGSVSTKAQPLVIADATRPVRSYQASASYETKDQVNHPTFGLGVVEEVMPGKIQVWFPAGRRVLAAAKPESLLAPGGRAGPIPSDS